MNYNNINEYDNLDRRMYKALEEERQKQREIEHKRKNKRYRHHIISILILTVVVIVATILVLVHFLSSNIYSDRDEFVTFADNNISETELYTPRSSETNYDFSQPFSVAIRRDSGINKETRQFRDKKIERIIIDSRSKADKNKTTALLIETEAFKSSNGVISLYIHYSTYIQDEKNMTFNSSYADTYLFDEKNMKSIEPLQALNVNYKDKASGYAEEYFSKTYNNKDIVEFYQDYTEASDENLNKFFMTKNNIVFVFDQHTVVNDDLGIATMIVPNKIIGSTIRAAIIDRYIDPTKPMVAITYDDGPGGKSETDILNTLSKYESVATFFYLGNRLSNFSSNVKKAASIGCEIGNHSWDHPAMTKLPNKKISDEFKKTNSEIYKICGVEPTLARPPYGDYNKRVLKASGMADILWTVDTEDWKSRNPKKIFKAVKQQKSLDGKIILMHSIYDETAEATRLIVPWLKEQGYQTVTVSEMIKYKTGSTPKPGTLYRTLK